jgi:hypothetical protein
LHVPSGTDLLCNLLALDSLAPGEAKRDPFTCNSTPEPDDPIFLLQ